MVARLGAADVAFLERVGAAVFHNPFSLERHTVDLELAEADGTEAREVLIEKVVARVEARLQQLGEGDQIRVSWWRGTERTLVEHAVLFLAFHRYADRLDAHIEAQIRDGGEPLAVPFASELAGELEQHGFSKQVALRMLAVFFQMRRAFYFVDRGLAGQAPSMRRLREQLWNNVCTADIGRYESLLATRMEDFSTIVLGPTGSGKGAAAAALGRSGYIPFDPPKGRFASSFTEAFVSINLSSYPPTLLESELFGHRKGAFTGAIDSHQGVLARCSEHGAVFLDEIGEVSIPVQIKLLRVLQERSFVPVGSHQPSRFRGRVIAATNQDLDQLRADGAFRDDFYYRLCSDVIHVPPLCVRLAEDPAELDVLLGRLLPRIVGGDEPGLAREVGDRIRRGVGADYAWPGNVRELEQACRRVLIGHDYRGDAAAVSPDAAGHLRSGVDRGALTAKDLVSLYCKILHARHGTYEEVARRTELDRRTVKKHVLA